MRFITYVCTAVLMTALISGITWAADENPAGKWWRLPKLSAHLELTTQEKDRLDALFQDNRKKLIDLRAEIEKEQLDLEESMESEPLNEKKTVEQFRKLDSARSALAEERFRYFLEIRKIVGADRFQKLKHIANVFKKEGGLKARGELRDE